MLENGVLTMKKSIAFLIIVLIAGAGLFAADGGEERILAPEKSELIPDSAFLYKLTTPPFLYHSRKSPEKDDPSRQAWHLANEFIFRTALRETVVLPSSSLTWVGSVCIVTFQTRKGAEDVRLMIDVTDQSVCIVESFGKPAPVPLN